LAHINYLLFTVYTMIQLLFKEPKVKSNMFKAKHSINRPIDPYDSSINDLSKFYSASSGLYHITSTWEIHVVL